MQRHSIGGLSPWFVVETLPRQETLALQHLQRQRFPSFCPRFRKTSRHARRIQTVNAPLFPGYIFVHFDPRRDPWRAINGTIGVKRLVGFAPSSPQAMPQAAMAALIERCDDDFLTRQLEHLELGRSVRLSAGPFADQLATIESLDDRGRVRVLIDFLGRATSLRVAARDLSPA